MNKIITYQCPKCKYTTSIDCGKCLACGHPDEKSASYEQKCLHKACENCKGTGIGKNGKPCVHGLSCPCKACSPGSLVLPNIFDLHYDSMQTEY